MVIDGVEFDDSGLMPKVDDEQFEWSRPDFVAASDPIGAVALWAIDIAQQVHIVWPALREGQLVVPPVQHVLDHLVRSRIAGESAEIEAELMLRPNPGTVAVVYRLPRCDFCASAGIERPARYDSAIEGQPTGMAYMCAEHYLDCSPCRLGLGEGQYLMTSDEVPSAVHEAYDRAVDYWSPGLSS
jgi:hypothetical protein